MMAEEKVFDQSGKIFWKIRELTDFILNPFYAKNDMAEESSLIGVVEGSLIREFVNLAQIVEDRGCDQEIHVQPTVMVDVFQYQLG
jgi:hypothetical protein